MLLSHLYATWSWHYHHNTTCVFLSMVQNQVKTQEGETYIFGTSSRKRSWSHHIFRNFTGSNWANTACCRRHFLLPIIHIHLLLASLCTPDRSVETFLFLTPSWRLGHSPGMAIPHACTARDVGRRNKESPVSQWQPHSVHQQLGTSLVLSSVLIRSVMV